MINQTLEIIKNSPSNKKVLVITNSSIYSSKQLINLNTMNFNKQFLDIFSVNNKLADEEKMKLIFKEIEYYKEITNNIYIPKMFSSLVKLEQLLGDNFLLVTSNIDGLHKKMGNYRVIELFDNIHHKNFLEENITDVNTVGGVNKRKLIHTHLYAQQADIIILLGNIIKNTFFKNLIYSAKKTNKIKVIELNNSLAPHPLIDYQFKNKIEDVAPLFLELFIDIEKGIHKNIKN